METQPRPSLLFQKGQMFTHNSFCKVLEVASSQLPSKMPQLQDYTQVWFVTKGCCEHWVEGERHRLVRGEALLLPPGTDHQMVLSEDGAMICCGFWLDYFLGMKGMSNYRPLYRTTMDFSFMLMFGKQSNYMLPKFTFSNHGEQRVSDLMDSMLHEYTQQSPFYEDYLSIMILELLLVLAREYSMAPSHKARSGAYGRYRCMVMDAIDHIDAHYADPITLEDVCKISMVSKTYFCYLFKLITEQTFTEYLMNKRIQKAMELIEQTDHSITDIGLMVGFGDSAHFSRTFKKLIGVAPRTYRTLKTQPESTDGINLATPGPAADTSRRHYGNNKVS